MEFISAEEFLKQSKKVQKEFIDWWQPSEGDIYSYIDLGERCRDTIGQKVLYFFKKTCEKIKITLKEWLFNKRKNLIPLLTEGQLREFISDKYKDKVELEWSNDGYIINIVSEINDEKVLCDFYTNEKNPLRAYWKVAVEIAENL